MTSKTFGGGGDNSDKPPRGIEERAREQVGRLNEVIAEAIHEISYIPDVRQPEEATFEYSELLIVRNEYINLISFFLEHTVALINTKNIAAEIKEELMSLLPLKKSQETVLGAGISQFEAAQAGYINHCEDIIRQLDEVRERFITYPEILESLQGLQTVIERLKENIMAIGQTLH